ncbi:MAG: hypothetical protein RLZZ126_1616 [Pseudomonadota bacterium]|jgi:copper chaperone CopZ
MKNTFKAFAVSGLVVCSVASFGAEVSRFTVNGMVCAFCAQGIEKTLTKMPETRAVYVNLARKVVAVEAKDGQKLDLKRISAGIVDAGYDVVKAETVSGTTLEAVRAEYTNSRK